MRILLVIVALVVFGAGIAAGYQIAPKSPAAQLASIQRTEAKKLMNAFPSVDFTMCEGIPDEGLPGCAEQALFNDAVTKKDASLCDRIQTGGVKDSCRQVISRQKSLGEAAQAFCQGLKTDALCLDLAQTLAAADNQSEEMCGGIALEPVRALCSTLTLKPSVKPAEQQALRFGYRCNSLKSQCDKEQAAFVSAVKSNDPAQCNELNGVNTDACKYDVVLYQAFLKKSETPCQKAPTFQGEEPAHAVDRCKVDLSFAQALETGNPDSCASLVAADFVESCKQFVKAAGEKRFDYLNAAVK